MAIVTPEQYYSDESNHGNYQWVTLKNVIDSFEFQSQDDDSYLKNTKRSQFLYHAKNVLREINRKASNDVRSFAMQVPLNLTIPMPQDYVNWVRVSVKILDESTGSYRLKPLDINRNIDISTGYLQDNDGEILFDNNGYILTSDGTNAFGMPYKKVQFTECGSQFKRYTSVLSEYGEFTIDEKRGKFLFSSEILEKEVVIEYVTDGLDAQLTESQIPVHKNILQALKDYTYYSVIELRRNVPQSEKERARRRYLTSLHQAKLDMMDFSFTEVSRQLRTKSMIL